MSEAQGATTVAKDLAGQVAEALRLLAGSERPVLLAGNGVHFSGIGPGGEPEPLIRYAVCADVLDGKFQERLESRLARLKPVY